MKSKYCFPSLIVCLLVMFSTPASAWSLYDEVQQHFADDPRCAVVVTTSDEGQAAEGEATEEEEPDCE